LRLRLHQEAIHAGELVLLLRQDHDIELFIYDIWDGEGVNVVDVILGDRRLGRDSLFDCFNRLSVIIVFALSIVIGRH
jgi:hypothetical protein